MTSLDDIPFLLYHKSGRKSIGGRLFPVGMGYGKIAVSSFFINFHRGVGKERKFELPVFREKISKTAGRAFDRMKKPLYSCGFFKKSIEN